jgi:hypothetical protein
VIIKSEIYHFHCLDLARQAGIIVTVYDEDVCSAMSAFGGKADIVVSELHVRF